MKLFRWATVAVAGIALSSAVHTCIEALTLTQMVAKTDSAVRGTITKVSSTKYDHPDGSELIYTILTVEGEDLYTGKSRTIRTAFVGGVHNGESMMVTSMPSAAEYRLGNKVLVFSSPVEGWGPNVSRGIYASFGGIYKEIATKRGPVFLGKGEGFAVSKNITLTQLRADIATALEAKQKQEDK